VKTSTLIYEERERERDGKEKCYHWNLKDRLDKCVGLGRSSFGLTRLSSS
jgi:hypothetical protein